ncbi:Fis family transcriptional regulator [Rhodopseudomonas palustris]|uniref:Fis family transcriptional regulator n=2 Tax=Nitrobacteraceae TaxID=41294 RepID=A0A0D7ELA4_RHOPL|nr:Fis family transcriptional regulator [Rhodopseudomonas palustris]
MRGGRDAQFAAARDLLGMIDEMIDGALLIDEDARIVWLNEKHVWFSPKQMTVLGLGADTCAKAIGKPVESLIPHSRMREVVETGRSIPLDIIKYGEHTLLVSRLPLRNESGAIIGAISFSLKNSITLLRPITDRFNKLNSRLANMEKKLAAARTSKYTVESLVGFSPVMLQLKQLIRKGGRINSSALLLGETGTGKELAAHAIHAASDRANGPFVGLNVAAIPENLLEAECFGVAPGAYTGASQHPRPGKFQLANGGTLFLDEIGDMPVSLQVKLLRVLQEREVEPLGSNQVVKVDVRIIAATSRALPEMIKEGKFRSDLFYRLNVLPIHLPPLRHRKEDLEILASLFSERTSATFDQPMRTIAPSALEVLHAYNWPGNVRELANVIEQVYARTDGEQITAEDFAEILPQTALHVALPSQKRPLAEAVDEYERSLILAALTEAKGNKLEAARKLGLARTNLYAKMSRHNISLETHYGLPADG